MTLSVLSAILNHKQPFSGLQYLIVINQSWFGMSAYIYGNIYIRDWQIFHNSQYLVSKRVYSICNTDTLPRK